MIPNFKEISLRGRIEVVHSSQARYDWQKAHSVGSHNGLVKQRKQWVIQLMVISRLSQQWFFEGCATLSNRVPGFHMSSPILVTLRSEPGESCHSKGDAIWIIDLIGGLHLGVCFQPSHLSVSHQYNGKRIQGCWRRLPVLVGRQPVVHWTAHGLRPKTSSFVCPTSFPYLAELGGSLLSFN